MSRRKHKVSAEEILQRIVQAGVKDNEIMKTLLRRRRITTRFSAR